MKLAHLYSLLVAAFVSLLSIPGNAADSNTATPNSAELRTTALAFFSPLPDQMPGADTDTRELIALGEKLYFEKKLSKNGTQSCNSCHRVDQNRPGVDNLPTSPGAFGKRGDRNSPTTLNAGFHFAQFWDGRAADLTAQAKGPILNPGEMAMPDETTVIERLQKGWSYKRQFKRAFPGQDQPITYDNLARAIAAFERTLITRDRFDDFLQGDDNALTPLELKGLHKFTSIGCVTCHTGPVLGGNAFQKVGLINAYENFSDLGLESVTKNEDDRFKFKVPGLRNIALTGPYFHDGGVASLDFAVRKMAWMQLGLQLNREETEAIVAFLHSLSDKERSEATE